MKKIRIVLFLAYVFIAGSVFAADWGDWNIVPHIGDLFYRLKYSNYNDYAKKYEWYIQFRNDSSSTLEIKYYLDEPTIETSKTSVWGWNSETLKPGETRTSPYFLIPNAEHSVSVFIKQKD